MLSVIKTGIITIILSFISGVLLDYYKNYAPRIVCDIGKGRYVRINNKRIKVYIITIKNISNKTIHDLNLNLQAYCDNFKIDNAKITNGLKFDILSKNNIYDVSIPFLSKNDEFSVKLFLQNSQKGGCRPIVTLRSPEKFKRIDSSGKIGSISNNSKGVVKDKGRNNDIWTRVFSNKKVIITVISILLVVLAGVFVVENYTDKDENIKSSYNQVSNEKDVDNSNNQSDKSNSKSKEKSKSSVKNENINKSKETSEGAGRSSQADKKTSKGGNSGAADSGEGNMEDSAQKNNNADKNSSSSNVDGETNKKTTSNNSDKKSTEKSTSDGTVNQGNNTNDNQNNNKSVSGAN